MVGRSPVTRSKSFRNDFSVRAEHRYRIVVGLAAHRVRARLLARALPARNISVARGFISCSSFVAARVHVFLERLAAATGPRQRHDQQLLTV